VELSRETDGAWLLVHCEATKEIQPPAKVRAAFESLAANRLSVGSLPADQWEKPLGQVKPSGEIEGPLWSVPVTLMPQAFQQFAADVQRELSAAGPRAIGLLRCPTLRLLWRPCNSRKVSARVAAARGSGPHMFAGSSRA
jgi:hypothetical protein